MVLHEVDTPTICALNGGRRPATAWTWPLGCDLRIAGESAKLAAAPVRRGVLPESGGTWLLPRLLGWAKAAEIAFTGRTLLADQCLELGLVNRVVADEQLGKEARALADEIAANAPLAVQATKRMMRMALDETFEANVHHVFLQLLPLFRSQDFKEGLGGLHGAPRAEVRGPLGAAPPATMTEPSAARARAWAATGLGVSLAVSAAILRQDFGGALPLGLFNGRARRLRVGVGGVSRGGRGPGRSLPARAGAGSTHRAGGNGPGADRRGADRGADGPGGGRDAGLPCRRTGAGWSLPGGH